MESPASLSVRKPQDDDHLESQETDQEKRKDDEDKDHIELVRTSSAKHKSEPETFGDLLVVGKKVNVKLDGWNADLGFFKFSCKVETPERSLEWTFSKAPLELFHFRKRLVSKTKLKSLPVFRETQCLGFCSRVPLEEEVEHFIDVVFGEESFQLIQDVEAGGAPPKALRKLDKLLSGFLQLSVASISPQFHYEGKFPEGYLMKAPMYYTNELRVMNLTVAAEMCIAVATLSMGTISVFQESIWTGAIIYAIGIGLMWIIAIMYVYLMRPKEADRTMIMPACFVPGLGQVVVFCFIVYEYFFRGLDRRWVVFRPTYIAYFDSNYDTNPRGVFILDRNTNVASPWTLFCNPLVLQISNSDQTLTLYTKSIGETNRWKKAIAETCSLRAPRRTSLPSMFQRQKENFGQRSKIPAQWYADARFLYRDMYTALTNAKHEIFITGWMVSPELVLVRDDDSFKGDSTLEHVLGEAVKRGVNVHVLVYRDVQMALPNNSLHAKEVLVPKGVQLIRHAAMMRAAGSINHLMCMGTGDVFWSHHEKLVIVDQALAFVGGIDLAFGRYDDHRHRLTDPGEKTWRGKDFYNVRLKEFEQLEDPFTDLVDRATEARMPWHDIHCCVGGTAARDVARHFIARWNRELRQNTSYSQMIKSNFKYVLPAQYEESAADALPLPYTAQATKMLRSVGPWSLSSSVENSIQNCYLELISEAERFIYIENQFFNSPEIAEALADRIMQAIDDDIHFRVVVITPQWPAFEGMPFDNPQTKIVLKYTHKTMDSILNRIRSHHRISTEEQVNRYIGFYSLRTAEMFNGMPKSEQVYVHAKLMIVDDEKCIIGSANLNGRSLRGDRDSEVCVYMHAPKFCRELRASLMAEHMGLHRDDVCKGCRICSLDRRKESAKLSPELWSKLKDIEEGIWQEWDDIADTNAMLLRKVFHGMQPVDDYVTIKRARVSIAKDPDAGVDPAQVIAQLRGHLVRTPLQFLRKEQGLLPTIKDFTTYIIPTNVFV